MRLNIFKKAKYLLTTKQIKKIIETDYSTSFNVGKYHVVAKYINHKLFWICNCQAGSNEILCAHKIAAQDYLIHNQIDGPAESTQLPASIQVPSAFPEGLGLDHLTEAQKYILRQMVNFTCEDCFKTETEFGKKLEVHRMKRGIDGGKYRPGNIKMLCPDCHDMYDY